MEVPKILHGPDYKPIVATPDTANMAQEPMVIDGVLHIPATTLQVATKLVPSGAAFVAVCLARGPLGLAHQVTASYARELAACLIGAADRADAHCAKVASEKLDEALAKGKQA